MTAQPLPKIDDEQGRVLRDGEFARMSLLLMDAAPADRLRVLQDHERSTAYAEMVADMTGRQRGADASTTKPPVSVDAFLCETIARCDKAKNMAPSEWLATQSDRQIKQLISLAVEQTFNSVRGSSLAETLGLDHAPSTSRGATEQDVSAAYDAMIADFNRSSRA
jgi:hypothetical protein